MTRGGVGRDADVQHVRHDRGKVRAQAKRLGGCDIHGGHIWKTPSLSFKAWYDAHDSQAGVAVRQRTLGESSTSVERARQ